MLGWNIHLFRVKEYGPDGARRKGGGGEGVEKDAEAEAKVASTLHLLTHDFLARPVLLLYSSKDPEQ